MRGLLCQLPTSSQQGWPWDEEISPSVYAASTQWPRTTIVTPSYNQGEFIEETIRSVLLQNYPNLQYIVIDGGSTDGTVGILEKYSPWIDYWVSEPDRGQSHAINKGLERADGEWCNWINSDDILMPTALIHLFQRVGPAGQPAAVTGRTEVFSGAQTINTYGLTEIGEGVERLFHVQYNQPGTFLLLEKIRQVGGIREDLSLTMDLDLWLRLRSRYPDLPVKMTDETVAGYRYHDGSKTCAGDDVFAFEEFCLLTDLVEAQGGEALPACLRELRQEADLPTFAYHRLAYPDGAHSAYARRLIESDSLLFRALGHTDWDCSRKRNCFLAFLEWSRARPRLFRKAGGQMCAAALVNALNSPGCFDSRLAVAAWRQAPTPQTAIELMRVIKRKVLS